MKRCTVCGESKTLDSFYKSATKSNPDRLMARCKACHRKIMKDYNEAHAARLSEAKRQWRANNRDKTRQISRDYYARNAAKCNAASASWRESNPDRPRQLQEQRKARQVSVWVEHIDRDEVLIRDGAVCYLCGEGVSTDAWHLDHIQPLTRGGEHSYDNVAVTHPECNLRKRDLTPNEYLLRLRKYPSQKG